ncbi:hypothetical protein ACODGN_003180 [Escherichia coli]
MLESFKELFSSTVSTAAQRVRNPAIGAFALSWCAFNWKSILYLLLSDTKVLDKITYISDNSTWKTIIGYPCVSVIIICGILPWANNIISFWQAKPLDNNDSIDNFRKAKLIHRATRLQRLQAKHDVTYEKIKTGAEQEIQMMKETILDSQARMGEITAEKERLQSVVNDLEKKLLKIEETSKIISNEADESRSMAEKLLSENKNLINELNNIKYNNKPNNNEHKVQVINRPGLVQVTDKPKPNSY